MRTYAKEFWTDKRVMFLSCIWLAYLVASLFTPYSRTTWLVLSGGILVFFVTEYFIHRYLLHGFLSVLLPIAYKGHEDHHHDPKNLSFMLTPNLYNIPGHFILWGLAVYLFRDLQLGSAIMLGYCTYQLYYEWAHYVSHRPIVPHTPWGKWMKKYHLLHHYKRADAYYGLTHPAFDLLFNKDEKPEEKKIMKTM